tara:strand:+ start:106 stop:294 length:189 start_codon:yes stop_codon:yes gene_type:complete
MFTNEILQRIAYLIVWARHSKPGDDSNAAPHDLTQKSILQIADELDSWLNQHKDEMYESEVE